MSKKYLNQNVDEALEARLAFIFERFENICVSFSGGKDSGLLLNKILDFKRRHKIERKICVFHQDFEAQYQLTTEFVTRMFEKNLADIEPYWECLPKASRCAVSNFQMYWYPWDQSKKEAWCRDMPTFDFIINEKNNPFGFWHNKISQEEMYEAFGPWLYEKKGKTSTIVLLGIRSSESLNRFRAYKNDLKETIGGHNWTTRDQSVDGPLYVGYPLYDWTTEDVWIANGKYDFDYNRLYDLFHKAGLKLHQMRVASPYHEAARHSLNLYRVIEPKTWVKIVARVNGANFAAIYGGTKALGYREVTLPPGHTWKSYTKFLLKTLPDEVANSYISKFKVSLKFWRKKGGAVTEDIIAELETLGYKINRNGKAVIGSKDRVTFEEIPDHTDEINSHDIPSWKRMCFCILKNDHLCKFMGFAMTKQQAENKQQILDKYRNL